MANIDKHLALGQTANLTLQIQKLETDRDQAAQVATAHGATAHGATASELAAVLQVSRATAAHHYLQHKSDQDPYSPRSKRAAAFSKAICILDSLRAAISHVSSLSGNSKRNHSIHS